MMLGYSIHPGGAEGTDCGTACMQSNHDFVAWPTLAVTEFRMTQLAFEHANYLESELKIWRNAIEARKSLSVFSPDYIDHLPRQRPIH
jgi:hypothetical protein